MSSVSELILNSGLFSPVWIAGTMKDKLGKKVVLSTDIADIAEKIMREDRINLVLRLSGMLLKGLVVVYSKKTQYMLNDCEDIITKIMQSFKTNAVNLPPTARSNDTITISINRQTGNTEVAIGNINDWIVQNPEDEYLVKQQFEIPSQSEASQVLTQFSDSSSSLSSTPSSQALLSDNFEPIQPPQNTDQNFEQLPLPQWDTDNDVVPMFEDPDDIPIDEPIQGQPYEQGGTETETETESENDKEKQRARIVDNEIDLPNIRGQNRRRARAPASSLRKATLPHNEELEELFELAKQEFNKPPQQNEVDLDNSDFAMPPPEDVRYGDALPDMSDTDVPEPVDISDDDDNRRISLPSTPNDYLDITRRNRISAEQTPNSVKFISPYPNCQFAIEKTPRRSVEDSITNETISVLNKIRKGLKDEDSITFNQTFSGSSRHGAASAFYQLLVLRSTGYTIDVEQEGPYEPIKIIPGSAFPSA